MFSALVPAAGMSTRLGRNKLLLPFNGRPLIAHAVDTLLASKLDEIIVVVGHESDRVKEAIGQRRVKIVENPRYREGLSTSVSAGLVAVSSRARAILIYLADQPLVEPEEINLLISSFDEADKANKRIVVPFFRGQRGNPVLVSSAYKASMVSISGETGCRRVIKQNPGEVLTIEMETDHVLRDMDTIEDYERIVAEQQNSLPFVIRNNDRFAGCS
jgi:molybdenum cofactor cytidylyltransferase